MIIKLKTKKGVDIYVNINKILLFNENGELGTSIEIKDGNIFFVEDTPEQIEEKINCSILKLEDEKAKIHRQYRM